MITIRHQTPEDTAEVRRINELAFGQQTEADLVEQLQQACSEAVSLVAEMDGTLVGHILFSPVVVESGESGDPPVVGMGLAPMAVQPGRQRQGIGSELVSRGLQVLRDRDYPFVVVVGHPEYYPRFGFERASQHGLRCRWEVPDGVFMALILDARAMAGVSGLARYRPEFDAVA